MAALSGSRLISGSQPAGSAGGGRARESGAAPEVEVGGPPLRREAHDRVRPDGSGGQPIPLVHVLPQDPVVATEGGVVRELLLLDVRQGVVTPLRIVLLAELRAPAGLLGEVADRRGPRLCDHLAALMDVGRVAPGELVRSG